jgi:hypothetical protein
LQYTEDIERERRARKKITVFIFGEKLKLRGGGGGEQKKNVHQFRVAFLLNFKISFAFFSFKSAEFSH